MGIDEFQRLSLGLKESKKELKLKWLKLEEVDLDENQRRCELKLKRFYKLKLILSWSESIEWKWK